MKIKFLLAPAVVLSLALSALLAFSACYEPREGCLDIEAVNFDAAADDNCCCTYPALQITFQPRYDTLVWKPDTAYQLESGGWFRIHQAVFYLSDFQMVQNGADLPVSDLLDLSVLGPGGDTLRTVFTNDFLLLRRTTANYTVGTFRPMGAFDAVRFRVGVPDAAQRVIPALAPEGHPLGLQNEGLWLGPDTGFVALKLVVSRDTLSATVPDTLLFSLPDFAPVLVQTAGAFWHESGYDFSIRLVADFRELFRGVDLSNGDIPAWKARIAANLPKALRVSP